MAIAETLESDCGQGYGSAKDIGESEPPFIWQGQMKGEQHNHHGNDGDSGVRLKTEIEAGPGLKLQAPLYAVALALHDDERGHEADNVEILRKLACVPHFPMFDFKSFTAARLGVDLGKSFSPDRFGRIVHSHTSSLQGHQPSPANCGIS